MLNGFEGSAIGNIIGCLYFLAFQGAGMLLVRFFFQKKEPVFYLLTGSVLGSVLLQWLPALFAFPLRFSVNAHLAALLSVVCLLVGLHLSKRPFEAYKLPSSSELLRTLRKNRGFLLLAALTFLFFCYLLHTHTLNLKPDGFHTGQCTYGDSNMHFGFITSLATQQTFPPNYSISPSDKLCYPFLCDSISASLYLFGASLRFSYMLPMYFAFLQVITGFYCIAKTWLGSANKTLLAWILFFFNGGLGFVYFLDGSAEGSYRFRDIFTGFYTTPTNLIDKNIRWVNIIVDMLLPQRATLFGYAVLFTCIWLLLRGILHRETNPFPFAALLAGALPMIHTHSFLAIIILSACWMLMSLLPAGQSKAAGSRNGLFVLLLFFGSMLLLEFCTKKLAVPQDALLYLGIAAAVALVLFGIAALAGYLHQNGWKRFLRTWGCFFLITVLLALPQLIEWTFGQTGNTGFLRGHFNWGNQWDSYLLFYIKNWGVILLLFLPAVIFCGRKNLRLLSGAFLIWFVAEIISFTPNTYDNNKLLYVTYIFICCISADFGVTLLSRLSSRMVKALCAACFLFLSTVSALLSMGREAVSDYQQFSDAQIAVSAFIEQNTPVDAVFLTNDRHVNETAALTGRNIVNGAPSFLWPHGIYRAENAADFQLIYEAPASASDLLDRYHIDYILISSWERRDYRIDEDAFRQLFTCVYDRDSVQLYRTEQEF